MYEWLKNYQKLEDEIADLEFNIERNKKELQRWVSGDLAKVKLTAESHGAQLEEIIEAAERELAHKMNDLEDMKKLINTFRGLDNKILYMKHVEGKTLISIADELGKSPNYIYNRHAQIMKMIDYAHSVNG
ncbi:hypothetical protein H9636_16070 [Ureibacillus sp. Re31]|uniref:Phage protein n=1 Tax=Ureibacillus galli TaxID=2762222 RepID=A0ABR8XG00_9BACL|nr:hypothetical protein [Ureibacillus galli]MBD8028165.1 hypothetical protein [Ureibacillus galli]